MTRDDFEAWRKDPVTKWVLAAVTKAEEQERAEWLRRSWDGGVADQMGLTELRSRANALAEVRENDFETWCYWNGDPIEQD